MAKIDISLIKTRFKEIGGQFRETIGNNFKNYDSKLNKIGYSILVFIFLYSKYVNFYGYNFFNYTISEYMVDIFLIGFFSYLLGFFVINRIFSVVFITIAEQIINIISKILRNK